MDKLKCYNCKEKDPIEFSVFCSEKCKREYAEKNHIPVPVKKDETPFEAKLAEFRAKNKIRVKTQAEREAEAEEAANAEYFERLFNRVDQHELQNSGVR